jgi:hypothetical protein
LQRHYRLELQQQRRLENAFRTREWQQVIAKIFLRVMIVGNECVDLPVEELTCSYASFPSLGVLLHSYQNMHLVVLNSTAKLKTRPILLAMHPFRMCGHWVLVTRLLAQVFLARYRSFVSIRGNHFLFGLACRSVWYHLSQDV